MNPRDTMRALFKIFGSMPTLRTAKPEPKSKHLGSKNHNQSTPKKRVLMAKRSNQINRKRCRKWKY